MKVNLDIAFVTMIKKLVSIFSRISKYPKGNKLILILKLFQKLFWTLYHEEHRWPPSNHATIFLPTRQQEEPGTYTTTNSQHHEAQDTRGSKDRGKRRVGTIEKEEEIKRGKRWLEAATERTAKPKKIAGGGGTVTRSGSHEQAGLKVRRTSASPIAMVES